MNKRDRRRGGAFKYVRGNYKPSKGTNLTVAARRRPFTLYYNNYHARPSVKKQYIPICLTGHRY